MDLSTRVVRKNGQEVKLTPTEYALLRLLVVHAGKVLTHRQLLAEVWGHVFHGYEPFKGDVMGRGRGALVCKEAGETTAHSLERLEERSTLFLPPGIEVYGGMICGESAR